MAGDSLYVVVTDAVIRNDNRLTPLKGRKFFVRRYEANRWGRCILSGQKFEAGAGIGYARVVEKGQTYYIEALLDQIDAQMNDKTPGQGYVRKTIGKLASAFRIPDDKISEFQAKATRLFLTVFANLILESRAGGGKTTMLRHLASFRSDGKAYIYLAFNSRNAKEGRRKLPRECRASTTHSFMGSVIDEHIQRSEKVLNKDWVILEDLYPAMNNKKRKVIRRATVKMVGLSKAFAIRPGDTDGIREVVAKYDFDLHDDEMEEAIGLCNDILALSLPSSRYGAIWNYDDMLWWPTVLDMTLPHFHVALLDEVQDFNACQIWMVEKLLEAGARIVAVGDPHQALYRFRGADCEAFDRLCRLLAESERGAEKVVLPISYRNARSIIQYVVENTHVKDIQARPDAPEGEVRVDMSYDEILDMLTAEETGAAA